jgi:hypothetical protein
MPTKICSKCGQEKEITEFQKCKGGNFGVRTDCKICHAFYMHNHYIKNREEILLKHKIWKKSHKNELKNAQIKNKYGITLDQYNQMLEAQNGVCAICENREFESENGKIRVLSIDHNHLTGKNRGLLCGKCNRMIGLSNDDNNVLISAINYLNKHNI